MGYVSELIRTQESPRSCIAYRLIETWLSYRQHQLAKSTAINTSVSPHQSRYRESRRAVISHASRYSEKESYPLLIYSGNGSSRLKLFDLNPLIALPSPTRMMSFVDFLEAEMPCLQCC